MTADAPPIITPAGRRFLDQLIVEERNGGRSLPHNFCHGSARFRLIGTGLVEWTLGDRLQLTDKGRRILLDDEAVDRG